MKKLIICLGLLLLGGGIAEASMRSVAKVDYLTQADGITSLTNPTDLVVAGDYAYFMADTSGGGRGLWYKATNTIGFLPASTNRQFASFVGGDQYLFTTETNGLSQIELWYWDGATGSNVDTTNIDLVTAVEGGAFYVKGPFIYFFDNNFRTSTFITDIADTKLAILPTTPSNAVILTRSEEYSIYYRNANSQKFGLLTPTGFKYLGADEVVWLKAKNTHTLYFPADTNPSGGGPTNLYRLPVESGAHEEAFTNVVNPHALTVVGDSLFFLAGASNTLYQLTDGASSPREVMFDQTTNPVSGLGSFTSVNEDTLYFVATNVDFGTEIWRCPINQAGTDVYAECLNINTIAGMGSNPSLLYEFGVGLAFTADDDNDGTNTLWICRYPEPPVEATGASGEPLPLTDYANFAQVNHDLWFSATDSTAGTNSLGNVLWKMDGSISVSLGYLLDVPTEATNWNPHVVAEHGPLTHYNIPYRPYAVARVVQMPDGGRQRVLFTDPGPGAVCVVNWTNRFGEPKTLRYEIEAEANPIEDTKLIYDTEGASRAPTVDLNDVPHNPVLCDNGWVLVSGSTNIPASFGAETNMITETWSGNIWIDDNARLHADVIDNSTGNNATNRRIVMLYEDGGGYYQGREVICIRQYLPDEVVTNHVGDLLEAHEFQDLNDIDYRVTDNGHPYVAAGKMNSRDDSGYIYQHNDLGDMNGRVYATRMTTNSLRMEIFWMRNGLYDVVWPYRMRRYTTQWPSETAQRFIRRADSTEPHVLIPYELNPYKMPEEMYDDPFKHGYLVGQEFYSDGPGYSLLLLESGPVQSRDWLEFVVVRSIMNTDTNAFQYYSISNRFVAKGSAYGTPYTNRSEVDWPIGTVITNDFHQGAKSGYLYYPESHGTDTYFHPGFYGDADAQGMHGGDIFAVNEGTLEVWWCNESHTDAAVHHGVVGASIQWPSYVMIYSNLWPDEYHGTVRKDTNEVVIAAQEGIPPSELPDNQWALYYQNNTNEPGFNPNDEHAIVMLAENGAGLGVFPLRCDLYRTNQSDSSRPYLLIENQGQTNELDVYHVLATNEDYGFHSSGNKVGSLIRIPYPLQSPPQIICGETYIPDSQHSAIWRDRKNWLWARAKGDDLSMSNKTVHFYYNVLDGFYFPEWYRLASGVSNTQALVEVPWLDALPGGTIGTPVNFTYDMEYADPIPVLDMGQTLTKSIGGLPAVWNQRGVEIIYQQATYTNNTIDTNKISVALIDPLLERSVAWTNTDDHSETTMPDDLKDKLLQTVDGKSVFKDLPAHLRKRLVYDEVQGQGYLRFGGRLIEPSPGHHYLLLNAINVADSNVLVKTFKDLKVYSGAFQDVLDAVIATNTVKYVERDEPAANLALSTGPATASGFVTLAFNNSSNPDINAEGDPISLGVIKVSTNLYTGEIFPINSDNPFDENLVMRHTLDFGGEGEYLYQWYGWNTNHEPPIPTNDPPAATWVAAKEAGLYKNGGTNEMSLIVGGNPDYVLNDWFFTLRYTPISTNHPLYGKWSEWVTPPKLASSWVKRVMDGINPFEQRVQTFDSYAPNTLMTMLEQVGAPYDGAVPLNLDHVDDYGLVEIYQTVLERALDLSYNGASTNNEGIDITLLLAAGRLADLYMILGNEAYADAQDPTIGFGTEHGEYGSEASSIFCFENIVPSLLDEELCLLRGRDDSAAPDVNTSPYYNRLPWNMSWDISGGEVAYALNYEITDVANSDGERVADGIIDEYDAAKLYPQGHGDAWGHYLSAMGYYYRLLHTDQFHWEPQTETIELNGQNLEVDYLDERKFAKAAAALARTGSELVSLTLREQYDTDAAARLSGYADSDTNRCWGVGDWASRAGQGAYFNWVVANAMLPETSTNTGLARVDRTTVMELGELAELGREIQQKLDGADQGLNPLDLAGNAIPFDISPSAIDQGQTHYEQIYSRALAALNNAMTVFDHAQNASQQLRRQFDTHEDFVNTVQEREFDFENRLIELYGYPYGDDIGPGKTYPQGYTGPDYLHYAYVDLTELLSVVKTVEETNVTVDVKAVAADGTIYSTTNTIAVHYAGDLSFFDIKPPSWTEPRRAPGEIQMARGELIQAIGRYLRAELEFENLLEQIEDQADLLKLQYEVDENEIKILDETKNTQESLNHRIAGLQAAQVLLRKIASFIPRIADAGSQSVPRVIGAIVGFSNGFITDPLGAIQGGIQAAGLTASDIIGAGADVLASVEQLQSQSKEIVSLKSNIKLTTLHQELAEAQAFKQLEQLVRSEASALLGLYNEIETIDQAAGRYYSTIEKAKRIEAERLRFRRQTAGQMQDYRYKDAAFRIFRNDALQRYRAQFDLAARYAYLAARAYSYETCLLDEESAGAFGGNALQDQIMRARTIGYMANGQPVWGSDSGGLAEALGELDLNWFVVGPQLGFENPQTETDRFSLRYELFRILPGIDGDATWRETLQNCVVDDIRDVPEFNKYCIPFSPMQEKEPGIVIRFSSCVNFGHNFFGWLAGGGDNSYDSANFATKIRSVGIWLGNYNNIQGGGLLNTPRVYLVPVGADLMRRPLGDRSDLVEFEVLDQALPLPLTVGASELADPSYIPLHHMGLDSLAQPRRFGSIRAYHDAGVFNDAETMSNSRLVGRSVWNTQWMLIIPAGSLHSDREEGLQRFINGALLPDGVTRDGNGVKDIKLFFQTYAYEGL